MNEPSSTHRHDRKKTTMRPLLTAAILAVAALALTGCSSPATYASPESLTDAYVKHGGECSNPQDIPEAMLSEGAHGILCGGGDDAMAILIVFDSTEAKDRYIARTGGDSDMVGYGGERWLALSEVSDVVSKLGGSEVED